MCIRVHPWPKNQTSKADRTPKKTSDLATDGHGYTRMRIAGFLALHREKIGTKLYGYALAKRYTNSPARGAAFFLGQNLTHGVYAPILRLEIGPDQHFAQQSRAEHHQAGQKEKAAGHHEGSVLDHDLVPQQLINRQVGQNQAAHAGPRQSQRAEEVHRAREILQQELDREDIEQHAECASQPVVVIAGGARSIAARYLG